MAFASSLLPGTVDLCLVTLAGTISHSHCSGTQFAPLPSSGPGSRTVRCPTPSSLRPLLLLRGGSRKQAVFHARPPAAAGCLLAHWWHQGGSGPLPHPSHSPGHWVEASAELLADSPCVWASRLFQTERQAHTPPFSCSLLTHCGGGHLCLSGSVRNEIPYVSWLSLEGLHTF